MIRALVLINRTTTIYLYRNLAHLFIFLYFFTTSADLLHIQLEVFRVKANHAIAILLSLLLLVENRRWVVDRKLFFSVSAIVISMALSLWQSAYLPRSVAHLLIFGFTMTVYFFLPLNLVFLYGRKTLFALYKGAFITTGIIAASQFLFSFFGIALPFVSQFLLGSVVRGQAMTYEPSYFALYMIAYVMYWNAKQLLSHKYHWGKSVFINFLLLASTSTGAFFSYFFFFAVVIVLQGLSWVGEFRKLLFRRLAYLGLFLSFLFSTLFFWASDLFFSSFWKFFVSGFMKHHSFTERWQGIVNAWGLFLRHPWFGVGVGGMGPALYKEYFVLNTLVEPTVEMMELYDPTNVLTELFATLGLCGVVSFALFFFHYWKSFCRAAKSEKVSLTEKKELYALLVSLCVMLLVWQFNQNLFRSYIWVHLAFCLGYSQSLLKDLE